jgi:LPXTG-motif cell wall-anchored protein
MQRRPAWASLAIVAAGTALLLVPGAAAGGGAEIAVTPAAVNAGPGEEFGVDYTVANAANIGGYTLTVRWDPAILEMRSMVDSGFVETGGSIVLCGNAQIDNAGGVASTFCTTIFALGPGVDAPGATVIASSVFLAKAAGETELAIGESDLSDTAGTEIASVTADGRVTVAAAAADTATAVPVSTNTPAPAATVTAGAAGTALPETGEASATSTSAARSTNTPTPTFSNVEVPSTGDGLGDTGGDSAWIWTVLVVAGLALAAGSGFILWRRNRQG